MAISKSGFSEALPQQIIYIATLNATVQQNVNDGPGTLLAIDIDNNNNQAIYLKMVRNVAATPGSTNPEWVFHCPANSQMQYHLSNGTAFDSLSVWGTVNPSPADSTAPTLTGNEYVYARLIVE